MENKRLHTSYLAILMVVCLLVINACVSPQKMIELGDYDGAISRSMKKLRGKKKKRAKFVASVEEAFQKAMARDLAEVERLKIEDRAGNWEKIHQIYARIDERQAAIEPLLPLIDKEGYKAEFRFVRTAGLLKESREKAAAYQYNKGLSLIEEARKGDRYAAREAYAAFVKSEDYIEGFRDVRNRRREAENLGTAHILFKMVNQAAVTMPTAFEREMLRMSVRDLDNRWNRYHLNEEAGVDYDYRIEMQLTEIEVSPDFIKEREYVDVKEIEEGFDYVLDGKGNVLKDSLGNDIKIPKKKLIQARVIETYQKKFARVAGRLEFMDLRSRDLIRSEPIAVDAIFDHYAATFIGDRRALSKESKRHIGNRPIPFPTNEGLLLQAAEELKPIVKNKMSRSKLI